MIDPAQELVELRSAHSGDGLGIARVRLASWRAAYAGILNPELLANLNLDSTAAKYEERFAKENPPDRTIVALHKDTIIGYCVCGFKPDAPLLGEPFMFALYVHPDQQGTGVGKKLLVDALEWAKAQGAERLAFGVFRENHPAKRFYERNGARTIIESSYTLEGVAYPTDYCVIEISPN